LAKHAGVARFAYNWGLAQRIVLYEKEKQSTNAVTQHRELNQLKQTAFPWMYEASKCAPQEALRDLDKAFANFFRGVKQGKRIGFPRFKKKGRHDSFRLTGSIKVFKKGLQLPRLGVVRLKEATAVTGRILSATVRREADRWYVSLAVETEIPQPAPVLGEVVGIDLGLNHFAVLSDGTKIEAPKPLKKHLKRLRRLSKRHTRKRQGSKNKKKSALALARLHRRIRNIRQDFLHTLTTHLAKTKSEIVLESLNVKGMMQNSKLSRAIVDVSWHEFRRQLEYKSRWYGSTLTFADRFHATSKTCSVCGCVCDKLSLAVRTWTCAACGRQHDRDVNAALNLRKLAGSEPT
jgi:putative transposase